MVFFRWCRYCCCFVWLYVWCMIYFEICRWVFYPVSGEKENFIRTCTFIHLLFFFIFHFYFFVVRKNDENWVVSFFFFFSKSRSNESQEKKGEEKIKESYSSSIFCEISFNLKCEGSTEIQMDAIQKQKKKRVE